MKDEVTVGLDTSGDGLYKRGYRAQGVAAPLKETLAAAMVKLSHYNGRDPFCDPFCGSGTIACAVAESTGLADGLFEQDYFQPVGVVRASVERRGGAVVSAAIGGPVTLDEPMCITL